MFLSLLKCLLLFVYYFPDLVGLWLVEDYCDPLMLSCFLDVMFLNVLHCCLCLWIHSFLFQSLMTALSSVSKLVHFIGVLEVLCWKPGFPQRLSNLWEVIYGSVSRGFLGVTKSDSSQFMGQAGSKAGTWSVCLLFNTQVGRTLSRPLGVQHWILKLQKSYFCLRMVSKLRLGEGGRMRYLFFSHDVAVTTTCGCCKCKFSPSRYFLDCFFQVILCPVLFFFKSLKLSIIIPLK